MIIVYGSSLAPSVRKVLAVIAEKGLAAEHRPLAPHDASPAFKETSPFGQIPGFRDGPFTLSDSSAICHYLERKYPEPALFPSSAAEYGRMVWFDQFADRFLGTAECKVVINRVAKRLRGEPADAAAVEQALTRDLPDQDRWSLSRRRRLEPRRSCDCLPLCQFGDRRLCTGCDAVAAASRLHRRHSRPPFARVDS
jgi:glutathione S-transferase